MEYTIKKLIKKEKDTDWGKKMKYYIEFEEETPFDVGTCYEGRWNSQWKVGDKLSLQDNQIKDINEWQGKKWAKIAAPPEAKLGGGISREEFDALDGRVKTLEGNAIKENGAEIPY